MFPVCFLSPSHPDVLTLSLSHLSTCYDITHTTVTSECQCHGHADSCHFSQRAWLSSGGTSGGVCDDCRHNTIGRRCQRCRHGYHHHPSLPLNSPHTCTRKRLRTGGSLTLVWDWLMCYQSEKQNKGGFIIYLISVELIHS